MANLTSSRIASLSLPPSSIAHLGIRGNALAGPSSSTSSLKVGTDGKAPDLKRLNSSLEEISDSDSEGSEENERDGGMEEEEVSDGGVDEGSQVGPIDREGDASFVSAADASEEGGIRRTEQLDADDLKQEALHAAMNDEITTPRDSPSIPLSPPPSYELATSFPLPKHRMPSSSSISHAGNSAAPSTSTSRSAGGTSIRTSSANHPPSPPPPDVSRPSSPKVQGKQPLPPPPSTSDDHPDPSAAQALIDQLAPEILERIPSSGSETSLYRAFRDGKSPRMSRRRTGLDGARGGQVGKGAERDEEEEEEEDGEEVDPNVFEMDISEPPSPAPGGRRRSSVSVLTGGNSSTSGKKPSSRKSRDKGKSRSSPSTTLRPLIRIVDRSGGAWNEAEEDYELGLGPDGEKEEEVDADELTRRILGEEADADAERGVGGGVDAAKTAIASPVTSPPKPETVASRAVKDRPSLPRSASTSRSIHNRSPLSPSRPQSPSFPSQALSRSESSLGTSLSPTGGPFARDVRVLGWRIVGGKTKVEQERSQGFGTGRREGEEEEKKFREVERGRIGAYVVYEVEVHLRNGNRITRLRRYNDFDDLRQALKVTFPKLVGGNALPKLPPKTNFSKFEPKFLDDRQSRLQYWLRTVLLHPDLGDCEVCRNWVLTH